MGRYSAIGMSTHTINVREMALQQWRDERAAITTELILNPDHLEEFRSAYPNGIAWILKERLADFLAGQSKKESNGQTVLRLMRAGRWRSFTHRVKQ
jgi:hypothetical protein